MAFSDSFRLYAAKRLKLPGRGKNFAEVGDDVTEVFKNNKWLGSLIDMGDLVLAPIGAPVDVAVSGTADPRNSEYQNASGASGHKVVNSANTEPVIESVVATPVVEEPEAAVVEEAADEAIEYMDDPSQYTVDQVLEYVNAHPDHAEMLLDAEREGKGRKSLMNSLTELLETLA